MISELCRLCGNKNDGMVCVFGEFSEVQQILPKIEKVLRINIEKGDTLPTHVCAGCVNQLDRAFLFINYCHETQKYLRGLCKSSVLSLDAEVRSPGGVLPSLESEVAVPKNQNPEVFKSLVISSYNNGQSDQPENFPSSVNMVVDKMKTTVSNDGCGTVIHQTDRKRSIEDSEKSNDETGRKLLYSQNRGSTKAEKDVDTVDGAETDDDLHDLKSENSFKTDSDSDDSDYKYSMKTRRNDSPKKRKQSKYRMLNSVSNVKDKKKSAASLKQNSSEHATSKDSDATISPRKELAKEKKRLTCATCKMSFTQELTYQEHLNVHTGNRPFACKLCEASFRKRQELNQHLRTVHSEKQFKCPLCEHVAKHKGKLTEHMKSVHEKPFACDQCNYRTGEKGKIQQHIANKHNGDLSYVCEICGNGFRTRTSLQAHRQNIHFPEPKVCQTCGTVCPSLARYSAHIFRCGKEKRRYPCEKCGQTYVNKEILKDHMNKHLNIRPYKCEVCGKEFFQRNRLDTHKYVHRGAAYRCEICNQSFNRKDNMKNHMKKHFYKSMRYDNMIVTAV